MGSIEQKIQNVNGSMSIEGMPLTDEDRGRLRAILHGKISYDAAIQQILEKYSEKSAAANE